MPAISVGLDNFLVLQAVWLSQGFPFPVILCVCSRLFKLSVFSLISRPSASRKRVFTPLDSKKPLKATRCLPGYRDPLGGPV